MKMLANAARPERVFFYERKGERDDAVTEVLAGLRRYPKQIHPKFFYDEQGSRLFDQITELPEYYPTRAEQEILRRYAPVIAAYLGNGSIVIEPGSGSSEKIALLLDSLRPSLYVPLDISADHLRDASGRLSASFPWLECHAVAVDYSADFTLPLALPPGKRVVFYPGSSIGNFDPPAAVAFLKNLADLAGPGGGLLIGVDLQKDAEILRCAYNDRRGVTAAFNRNVLRHINRLTGANFAVEAFDHVAFYSAENQRIEMHLQCRYNHTVTIDGEDILLRAGERIHTENSYKYTVNSFAMLAAKAGFKRQRTWYDSRKFFSVHYMTVDSSALFDSYNPFEEHRLHVAPGSDLPAPAQ